MKIVVAPDSFKGSLSAQNICDITETAAKKILGDVEIIKVPMADGGEGTVESVLDALNGTAEIATVSNPLGKKIQSNYGFFGGTNAIMEMASASGITLVTDDERDIFAQNTYGTGEMILDAINKGAKKIYIGIGGSATNDGGIGFASAIGIDFIDKNGEKVNPIPQNFKLIADFDDSNVDPRIKDTEMIIMSDVSNPLLGETGATYVFGRQKGAVDNNIDILEDGMSHYAKVLEEKLGRDIKSIKGAGAAGGLGAGLLAFTNAKMQSGVETIIDIVSLKEHLNGADLAITGEGMMDFQSAFGKVAAGVGGACKEQNIPCVAIVGSMGKNAEAMYDYGITSIITTVNGVMDIDKAINNAHELAFSTLERMFKIIKIGQSL
ncbi:MAG: glycerate kinase [Clostridia bacterium]